MSLDLFPGIGEPEHLPRLNVGGLAQAEESRLDGDTVPEFEGQCTSIIEGPDPDDGWYDVWLKVDRIGPDQLDEVILALAVILGCEPEQIRLEGYGLSYRIGFGIMPLPPFEA